MESLENVIYRLVAEKRLNPKDAAELIEKVDAGRQSCDDDIAIIGMACRLPGAKNVEEYWSNLVEGRNCIGKFPESRRKDALELSNGILEGEEDPFLKGGYLDDVDKFDPVFFRMSPQVAKWTEPSHRLFLLTAWEAFEDAGYCESRINGTNTGVYAGIDHTYRTDYGENSNDGDFAAKTGTWTSLLAGRVAYALDLHGPNIVIDTACSAGLVAVHTACNALNNGECDMAVAGGINFLISPTKNNNLDMVQSGEGVLRAFDKNANGTVWGEGICTLLLKPLKKAIEDCDNIHAVIRGSAISNDGASGAITSPSAEAQENAILNAWRYARVEPETISYIEAHGTGTNLGDPIELKGITKAFRKHTNKSQFCGIGSVKTCIGHSVAASGIASMIKVIMSMKHGVIPASINFKQPNPYISFCDSPVYVNDRLRKWETEGYPKRAGVSAFGFSGTNCHIVLEEAPEEERLPHSSETASHIVALSAKSEELLIRLAKSYGEFLAGSTGVKLEDICYTANTGRKHYFNHRLAVIGSNREDIQRKLEHFISQGCKDMEQDGICYGAPKTGKNIPQSNGLKVQDEGEPGEAAREAVNKIKGGIISDRQYYELLKDLGALYISGAEVDWEGLYEGTGKKRVSVPGYPLKYTRCWVDTTGTGKAGSTETGRSVNIPGKPLLGYCLGENIFNITYQSELSPQTHWVLSDHKIVQRNVLPGTSYIEIAVEACEEYYCGSLIELRDVVFIQPLMFNENETKSIQTVIVKKEEYIEFVVCSKQQDEWIRHAEGKAYKADRVLSKSINIEDIKSRCNNRIDRSEIKEKTDVSEFGPRWNTVNEVFAGTGEMLIAIELQDEISADLEEYKVHPALLDNAVNMSIRLNDEDNYYLPFSYRSFKLFDKMPERFYSYVKNKGLISDGSEIISFDICLIDMDGNTFIEINDYTIKKVNKKEFRFRQGDVFFRTSWTPAEIKNSKAGTGSILVFKGKSELSRKVIGLLEGTGREVIEVGIGEAYREISGVSFAAEGTEKGYDRLIAQLKNRNISQIVHLLTLDDGNSVTDIEELEQVQRNGVYSLFYLVKALVLNGYTESLDILLVSCHANEVTGYEETVCPHNAEFFGMGKVASGEYGNLKIRCMDIDKHTQALDIINEMAADVRDYIASYRNGERYIEIFERMNMAVTPDRPFEVKNNGAYIITGGMGGIGGEICKYLASHTEANICLLGRSVFPEREKWDDIVENGADGKIKSRIKSIMQSEKWGARVDLYNADVTDYEQIEKVFRGIREKYGRINGVFHCAGVAGNGFIMRKDEHSFRQVIAPKVLGTWNLDKITENDDLDIFVLFSTIFTLIGGPGQSDYCAANSYLDAYTAYRNKKGKRTLTINWPGWNETGMAADFGLVETSGLFKTLSNSKAVGIFDEIVNKDIPRVFAGEFDFDAMGFILDNLNINFSADIKQLIDKRMKQLKVLQKTEDNTALYNAFVVGKGEDELTGTEKKVAQIWAHIIGLEEINIYDQFGEMGGDSILASNLLKEMDKNYPNMINISDIYTYPTVNDMAEYLDKKPGKNEAPVDIKDTGSDVDDILEKLSKGEISIDGATKLFVSE